jgi:hypothetical protein
VEPLRSIKDLAATILKKCCTIFIPDANLLLPGPHLLEMYQEAIGDAVSTRFLNTASMEQSNNEEVN